MATTHFAELEGAYTLDVNLFDEVDGASEIAVLVDGVLVERRYRWGLLYPRLLADDEHRGHRAFGR